MLGKFLKLRLSTRDSTKIQGEDDGFTLIELIVSAVISLIILAVSLGLINDQRREFLGNQNRSQANQNLRAAMDIIGTDIKLAGERLETVNNLPVIKVINGNGIDGDRNEHDRLILQRKVISDTLTVCDTVSSGTSTPIIVAKEADLPSSDLPCGPFLDADNGNAAGKTPDALHDNLNTFKDYRCSLGATANCDYSRSTIPSTAAACDDECAIALIFDPATGNNEFFYYVYEDCTDDNSGSDCAAQIAGTDNRLIQNRIHAVPLEGNNWVNTYSSGSLIYIFEEREYSFDDDNGILELVINRQDRWADLSAAENNGNPLRLVNQLQSFNVQAGVSTNTTPPTNPLQSSINDGLPGSFIPWQRIHLVRVELEASNPSTSDLITLPRGGCDGAPNDNRLCLASEFFPRNALSAN
ncbi:MAG: PilW family protein [Thermosynechococcaceae cyanobacterium]